MTRAAATQGTRPVPGRIGGVLKVLGGLIAYARSFAATAAARAAAPEFPIVAAIFGTHDLAVILNRVQRGLLRALALRQYLLDRAASGRNLRFAWPPRVDLQPRHRPPPRPARAPRPAHAPDRHPGPATPGPDDPAACRLPTPEELDAWVRRRPVGRTVADICQDLGIVPSLCEGDVWTRLYNVFCRYGGSLNRLCERRAKREESFQKERDRRPETWDTDWRDVRKATLRVGLGCPDGETILPTNGLGPSTVPS